MRVLYSFHCSLLFLVNITTIDSNHLMQRLSRSEIESDIRSLMNISIVYIKNSKQPK
jgi:hypothetical protein